MQHLFGDSLWKGAGLTRVLKPIAHKPVQVLDKHTLEHAEVAEVVQWRLECERAGVFEDLLARCKCRFLLYH